MRSLVKRAIVWVVVPVGLTLWLGAESAWAQSSAGRTRPSQQGRRVNSTQLQQAVQQQISQLQNILTELQSAPSSTLNTQIQNQVQQQISQLQNVLGQLQNGTTTSGTTGTTGTTSTGGQCQQAGSTSSGTSGTSSVTSASNRANPGLQNLGARTIRARGIRR
jgi:TolA-binding protein